jgi:hypothetical protein
MLASSLFSLLAGAAVVAAQYPTDDQTTTSTMTMTATVTITKCNPTNTNCPAYSETSTSTSTSSSEVISYPIYNTTVSEGPTGYPNTTIAKPTGYTTQTTYVGVTPTKSGGGVTVPTSAASGLFLQSGLLLGIVAAGVTFLA